MARGGPQNGRKTDGQSIEAAKKSAEACELRLQGYTFDEIAEKLGLSCRQRAHDAVMRGLRDIVREPATEVLKQELERLDKIWHAFYWKAVQGDEGAADMCLKIQARRAKYQGLEAPEKSITATAELKGNNVEVSTLVQRLLRSVDGRLAACELVEESQNGESSHVQTEPDGTSEPNSGA